jgi:hypothetical protein
VRRGAIGKLRGRVLESALSSFWYACIQ